ncbi:hypothetical protein NBRC116494_12120 [Aurantivibrio plasticivorans]
MKDQLTKGLLWGVGFCSAVFGFVLALIIINWVYQEFTTRNNELPDPVKVADFSIVKSSYRFVPSSDEFRGGLVLSGQLSLPSRNKYGRVKVKANVFNNDGVYIDTCYEWEILETRQPDVYFFKISCPQVTDQSQYSDYEFEVFAYELE